MKVAAIVVLCALAVGMAALVNIYRRTMVLERRYVAQLKVAEFSHDGKRVVRVSGLSGHGFWSVKDVTTQRLGSSITVLVTLFVARSGTSGWFQCDIPVPDDVNQISFGRDEVVIWHR
jgi:hypothetical protein